MLPAPPTMQTVATAAGVGKATVSLALRDDPRLRAATRKRIQRIAKKLGYRPNATVASLMAQLRVSRTPKYQATLGLLNASKYPDALTGLHTFRDWITGVTRRAEQLGYGIDEFWLHDPSIPPSRLARILESRGIRGLVVAAILDRGALPAAFKELSTKFASVAVGLRTTAPALHFSCNDQYFTALEAVQQVIKLGYQRPGLVMSRELDAEIDCRFTAGFWVGQQALPPAQRLTRFAFEDYSDRTFRKWIETQKPDAIVCIHGEVQHWLEKMELGVPDDIALVHLDLTDELPGWAGMHQNNELVGMAAIDILVGQLHRNESGIPDFPKCVQIQSTWVPGATIGAKKKGLAQ